MPSIIYILFIPKFSKLSPRNFRHEKSNNKKHIIMEAHESCWICKMSLAEFSVEMSERRGRRCYFEYVGISFIIMRLSGERAECIAICHVSFSFFLGKVCRLDFWGTLGWCDGWIFCGRNNVVALAVRLEEVDGQCSDTSVRGEKVYVTLLWKWPCSGQEIVTWEFTRFCATEISRVSRNGSQHDIKNQSC